MQHLEQKDLAQRWLISPRTLEQWRWQGKGPRYLKIGSRVIYPLPEIEAYEAARLHANTIGPVGDHSAKEARASVDPACSDASPNDPVRVDDTPGHAAEARG